MVILYFYIYIVIICFFFVYLFIFDYISISFLEFDHGKIYSKGIVTQYLNIVSNFKVEIIFYFIHLKSQEMNLGGRISIKYKTFIILKI